MEFELVCPGVDVYSIPGALTGALEVLIAGERPVLESELRDAVEFGSKAAVALVRAVGEGRPAYLVDVSLGGRVTRAMASDGVGPALSVSVRNASPVAPVEEPEVSSEPEVEVDAALVAWAEALKAAAAKAAPVAVPVEPEKKFTPRARREGAKAAPLVPPVASGAVVTDLTGD